ncbi:hypothetical protein D3C87_2197350 [compost metagenome]
MVVPLDIFEKDLSPGGSCNTKNGISGVFVTKVSRRGLSPSTTAFTITLVCRPPTLPTN